MATFCIVFYESYISFYVSNDPIFFVPVAGCTQNPVGVYFTAFLNYVNILTSCPRICVVLREVIRYPLQKFFLYREQNIILRANIFHYIPLLGLCGTEDSHRVSEWSPEPEFLNLLRSQGIDSQPCGPVQYPCWSYGPRPATTELTELISHKESIPWNRCVGSLKV
jgi:hypothetical protein